MKSKSVSAGLKQKGASRPMKGAKGVVRAKGASQGGVIEAVDPNFQQIFFSNPLPSFIYDPRDLQLLAVNDASVREYGYSREEFLRMKMSDLRPAGGGPAGEDFQGKAGRHRKKSGEVFDVQITGRKIQFDGRNAFLEIVQTSAVQETAGERRPAQDGYLLALLENLPLAVMILDENRRIPAGTSRIPAGTAT